jgi:hypothetical protein
MWDWWCNFGVYVVAAGPLVNEGLKKLTFLNFSQFFILVICTYWGAATYRWIFQWQPHKTDLVLIRCFFKNQYHSEKDTVW